jgi:hypothetical protein
MKGFVLIVKNRLRRSQLHGECATPSHRLFFASKSATGDSGVCDRMTDCDETVEGVHAEALSGYEKSCTLCASLFHLNNSHLKVLDERSICANPI